MNKEIKTIWVSALRSGGYKQGSTYLRQGDKYCPLGILCDLAIKEGTADYWLDSGVFNADGDNVYAAVSEWEVEYFLPPAPVFRWAGLPYDDKRKVFLPVEVALQGGFPREIQYFNDELEMPFNEIADLIEEQL